jgi:hypothetical protein
MHAMKTKIPILVLVLVLSLVLGGLALANGGLELPRWALGGGASDSAAGGTALRATLGQPVVGVVSAGVVTLGQGFWHGGSLPEGGYDLYLPIIKR